MNRKRRKEIAQETVQIMETGRYQVDGETVDISEELEQTVAETETFAPDDDLPLISLNGDESLNVEVTGETTLAAAHRLLNEGVEKVAALNFASAKHPGGGFLNGSQAQEESLARASGLYACIEGSPMYAHHKSNRDPHCFYEDFVIRSPDVPVFRDDDDELLASPYPVTFFTSPAVNAGVARQRGASAAEIEETMRSRIQRLLHVAWLHEDTHLVLGAWGCGVFRNDPHMIARLFKEGLDEWEGAFGRVVFAIYGGGPNLEAFREVLGCER